MNCIQIKLGLLGILLFIFQTIELSSQNVNTLSTEQENKIDEMCSRWDKPNNPGVAIMIMNNGELVYEKCLGLADVENQIPIRPTTVFPLAQLSSHFTAVASYVLIEKAKLSLDAPITKYLSDMPDFYSDIRIKDLLQHSSGIDDYHRLRVLAAEKNDDIITQADALRLLRSQQNPLFISGSETKDSPSNILLLSEIIAAVSGKGFAEFMHDEIFKPLGMINTHIIEDINQNIDHAAVSYSNNDLLTKQRTTECIYGVNNIHSCLNDLVKWEKHLNKPHLLTKETVNTLNTLIEFDYQGRTIKSFGTTLGQIGYHAESGAFKWWMNGSSGGYTSCVTKLADKGFSSYIFANTGERYTGFVSVRAALITHPDVFVGPTMIDYSKVKTLNLTNIELEPFCGDYWDEESGLRRKIALENDTLRYVRTNGYITPLLPIEKNRFQMMSPGDTYMYVEFKTGKDPCFYFGYPEFLEFSKFELYDATKARDLNLKEYEGNYVDDIFDVAYKLSIDDGKLVLQNYRLGETVLTPVRGDTFSSDRQYFTNIRFKRDRSNNIEGIYLMHEGKKNQYLHKINLNLGTN